MKGIIAVALVLALAGLVIGVIALLDDGSSTDSLTLELTGGAETRVDAEAPLADKSHPADTGAFASEVKVSGDRTGEFTRVCQPIVRDDFQCQGAFLLDDGEIEITNTQESDAAARDAAKNASPEGVVVGGTGAYAGASGTVEVRWEEGVYTLDLELPAD